MSETNFENAIALFIANCEKITLAHYENYKFKNPPVPTFELEYGKKFIRVVKTEAGRIGGSAHAFIAIGDGQSKGLGVYKAGDVFKPKGWAGPAKNVRGNIFDENNGTGLVGPYGL